jgi:hypothetical protein
LKKPYIAILVLLAIYFVFSVVTLLTWHHKGRYSVTGDEPHYLVMASGIARHGSFEQTVPYSEEFRKKEIYKPGLTPSNAVPSLQNTHAGQGPNGLFNVHNVGLPLILSLPFLLGGVMGAKIFLILVGGLAVVVAWKISGVLVANPQTRFLSTLAVCVALPLIPSSNQIYPDILAGIIALSGIYWFMTTKMQRPAVMEGFWAAAIVFLPWLQIKFAAACVILVIALTLKIYLESKDIQRVTRIILPAIFSCTILALYNYYAFGKFSGPYQSGALELSKTSLMVLLGLHFDQNQGFLLQNPIMFVGVFSIGALFAFSKRLALLWLLVFLSLIVPNALHPNWYGGGSFSGRFAWTSAIVFILPTLFGLFRLAEANYKAYKFIIGSAVILQLYFFYQYLFGSIDLYNKGPSTWLDNYSIFFFPIHAWMPAFYNVDWAYSYGPNFGWFIVILLIFALGFTVSMGIKNFSSKAVSFIVIVSFLIIFASGFIGKAGNQEIEFSGNSLPSQSGRVQGAARVATQGRDVPGFVTFGPYVGLRKGLYRVMIRYSSIAPIEQPIGKMDIYDADNGTQIAAYPLHGTVGAVKALEVSFEVHNWKSHKFEFRTYWDGMSEIQVHGIELKRF